MGRYLTTLFFAVSWALIPRVGVAQPHHGVAGHLWPDSLDVREYSGVVIVDTTAAVPRYILDTNQSGLGDFILEFGPPWYSPGSGVARPANGDAITVSAHQSGRIGLPVLVVFSIDGMDWRTPMHYGSRGWNMEPAWSSPATLTSVTGTIVADTTFFYSHLYLDTDDDGLPEFALGLGPMWYAPDGARRPAPGDAVDVTGWVNSGWPIPMLIVATLDGQEWRAPTGPATWAGSWIGGLRTDSTFAYCVTDSLSHLVFPPQQGSNWGGGMMGGGMMWPDSTHVQFWNVPPDSLPGAPPSGAIAGFFLDVSAPTGTSMMTGAWGGQHGMMSFPSRYEATFHYGLANTPTPMPYGGDVSLHYWSDSGQEWREVAGYRESSARQVLTVSTHDLSQYFAVVASPVQTAAEGPPNLPGGVQLAQNHPNPFSASTSIGYELMEAVRVVVRVFDLLGREVSYRDEGFRDAGSHVLRFSSDRLSNGVYVYRLSAGSVVLSRQMTVLR